MAAMRRIAEILRTTYPLVLHGHKRSLVNVRTPLGRAKLAAEFGRPLPARIALCLLERYDLKTDAACRLIAVSAWPDSR